MKYFLLVLVVCATFATDVLGKKRHKHHPTKSKNHGSKIVGGIDADIKNYPYQAYLLIDQGEGDQGFFYECGGSILNKWYILSAAHCFADGVKSVKARIGSTDKFEGGNEYEGDGTYHEKYDSESLDFDIAYFKSRTEMMLDEVNAKAITLIEEGKKIPSGTMLKVSGWGDTSDGGDDSETLRAVEIPTLSNEECTSKPGFTDYVSERQFCGGYKEGGKDHCEGDSGGPAVIADSNVLAGVVSGGAACAAPDTPGVYVNITDPPIRSWILQHTGL